ncbi:hypothetical protein Tco_1137359, partial [Tanacetum coccineum]
LLPTDHYNLFGFAGDAADLFVAAIHGGWHWWSVGDVGHQHVSQPTTAVGINRYAISDGGAHGDVIHAANVDTYDSISARISDPSFVGQ